MKEKLYNSGVVLEAANLSKDDKKIVFTAVDFEKESLRIK